MACGTPTVCYPYGKPSNGKNPYASVAVRLRGGINAISALYH